MLKLLFLDIDGVLNNIQDATSYYLINPERYGISSKNIENLKYIMRKTNVKIVSISSWRYKDADYEFDFNGLKFKSPFLEFKNMIPAEFFYKDPDAPHLDKMLKCTDILGFFYKNNLKLSEVNFAVVDDQVNQGLDIFKENFFKTDPKYGLTEDIATNIIFHLNKETK